MKGVPPGTVLIVEDDSASARSFARAFGSRWPVECVPTVRDGLAWLDAGFLVVALVADGHLPDGSGLEVMREARGRHPALPMLAVTGYFDDAQFANGAQALGAEYAQKPTKAVHGFAHRLAIREHTRDERAVGHIDAEASAAHLTLRETEILALAVLDHDYEAIAAELGLTLNTVKSHAKSIADRFGGTAMGEVAWRIRTGIRASTLGGGRS